MDAAAGPSSLSMSAPPKKSDVYIINTSLVLEGHSLIKSAVFFQDIQHNNLNQLILSLGRKVWEIEPGFNEPTAPITIWFKTYLLRLKRGYCDGINGVRFLSKGSVDEEVNDLGGCPGN